MYLFLQRQLSLNNSHVIAVIHFHFCSFNNNLKQETPLHSPRIYEHFTLCQQQLLCSHIYLTSADLLVLHLCLCRVRKVFHFCPSSPIFWKPAASDVGHKYSGCTTLLFEAIFW